MNLGQAVAVCLYELKRNARATTPGSRQASHSEPASAEMLELITTKLVAALHASGYVKTGLTDSPEEKARRLVLRLKFSAADAAVFLGMLRQILWKLGD